MSQKRIKKEIISLRNPNKDKNVQIGRRLRDLIKAHFNYKELHDILTERGIISGENKRKIETLIGNAVKDGNGLLNDPYLLRWVLEILKEKDDSISYYSLFEDWEDNGKNDNDLMLENRPLSMVMSEIRQLQSSFSTTQIHVEKMEAKINRLRNLRTPSVKELSQKEKELIIEQGRKARRALDTMKSLTWSFPLFLETFNIQRRFGDSSGKYARKEYFGVEIQNFFIPASFPAECIFPLDTLDFEIVNNEKEAQLERDKKKTRAIVPHRSWTTGWKYYFITMKYNLEKENQYKAEIIQKFRRDMTQFRQRCIEKSGRLGFFLNSVMRIGEYFPLYEAFEASNISLDSNNGLHQVRFEHYFAVILNILGNSFVYLSLIDNFVNRVEFINDTDGDKIILEKINALNQRIHTFLEKYFRNLRFLQEDRIRAFILRIRDKIDNSLPHESVNYSKSLSSSFEFISSIWTIFNHLSHNESDRGAFKSDECNGFFDQPKTVITKLNDAIELWSNFENGLLRPVLTEEETIPQEQRGANKLLPASPKESADTPSRSIKAENKGENELNGNVGSFSNLDNKKTGEQTSISDQSFDSANERYIKSLQNTNFSYFDNNEADESFFYSELEKKLFDIITSDLTPEQFDQKIFKELKLTSLQVTMFYAREYKRAFYRYPVEKRQEIWEEGFNKIYEIFPPHLFDSISTDDDVLNNADGIRRELEIRQYNRSAEEDMILLAYSDSTKDEKIIEIFDSDLTREDKNEKIMKEVGLNLNDIDLDGSSELKKMIQPVAVQVQKMFEDISQVIKSNLTAEEKIMVLFFGQIPETKILEIMRSDLKVEDKFRLLINEGYQYLEENDMNDLMELSEEIFQPSEESHQHFMEMLQEIEEENIYTLKQNSQSDNKESDKPETSRNLSSKSGNSKNNEPKPEIKQQPHSENIGEKNRQF